MGSAEKHKILNYHKTCQNYKKIKTGLAGERCVEPPSNDSRDWAGTSHLPASECSEKYGGRRKRIKYISRGEKVKYFYFQGI